jgi:hypothetical protein
MFFGGVHDENEMLAYSLLSMLQAGYEQMKL